MSRHPELKWAQREDKVFLTVLLPDAKDAKVKLEPEGVFVFSASAGAENHQYELKLDLFDKVNVEESKISIGVRSIVCIVEKAENVWWSKLLKGAGKTPHYVKVDWDKWVDEDEDPPAAADDMGMGGMDFSKLAGMGGEGGMGGMDFSKFAGMGGEGEMGDFDDSDDDQEVSKPGEPDAGKSEAASSGEKKEATPST
ncbi:uncharacterized protein OsI_027940-like isoform X3 [Argentina anserina]|uniref:uncharacterized protein OsI_027940-like isoform X3 n=1 Tax=Argentina anserina TaxID=57926 RepID=UPI0021764CDB|nr:uncharacterized protein OsI_027940-like isoform X3 [Potentilla anserina]